MRGSVPITFVTATTSASARSHMRASALAKEIFMARNALQACLDSSDVAISVSISWWPCSTKGA
jgi:hypothetical protein